MLGVIIYGGSDKDRAVQRRLIKDVLKNYSIDNDLYSFSGLNDKLVDIVNNNYMKKIYVVNISDKKFYQVLSLIRKSDPYSMIILISNSNEYHYNILNNKLMVLDFIMGENYLLKLRDDLNYAIDLIYKHHVFTFKYKHIVYAIPYDCINYIEKELTVKRCVIHTLNGEYYVVSSLNKILTALSAGFFRAHQSCIVNKNNIRSIDLANNKIIFNNGDMTSLLSIRIKKDISKYVDIG